MKTAHAGWVLLCCLSLSATSCAKAQAEAPPPTEPAATTTVVSDAKAATHVPDASDVAEGTTETALQSSVARVTVYSDRARVTRRATTGASSTPTTYAFRNLPGWVDDGSVRVAASSGRLIDVRVERNFLAKATDKRWQRAEDAHEQLTSRLAALDDELKVLDAQKAQIESIKAFSLEKITKDTTIGDISVKSYGDVVEFISDALRSTAKSRRAVQLQRDRLAPEVEASARTLEELGNLMKLEETSVLVTLQSDTDAASTLELTYMLPGATWEPMHELRVGAPGSKDVEMISYAAVTQTSGEDWGNAEISFSTQSTSQSIRIPELEALTLGDTHTATRILTSKVSSFTRAQKAFEGQNQLWNKVHQKSRTVDERSKFEQVYQSNIEYLQVVQNKTVEIFESLQKRGTTAHFVATSATSVRGDGHPVRMRIGRSSLESRQQLVAAPEQSLNAARTLAMANATGQPILPGKVALYQDGAFIGMTDVDFIAEGEDFSLFLNVADHIKLSRKLDRRQSSLIRKKRNRMQVAFVVSVENLSSEESTLTLADRIPVSENRDIKVDRVTITPAVRPNSRGLLHWALTLAPREKREFRISYQVDYPAELVIESRRKRKHKKKAGMSDPFSAGASESYDIGDQILDLEERF